jgi:hypothetical protein
MEDATTEVALRGQIITPRQHKVGVASTFPASNDRLSLKSKGTRTQVKYWMDEWKWEKWFGYMQTSPLNTFTMS